MKNELPILCYYETGFLLHSVHNDLRDTRDLNIYNGSIKSLKNDIQESLPLSNLFRKKIS